MAGVCLLACPDWELSLEKMGQELGITAKAWWAMWHLSGFPRKHEELVLGHMDWCKVRLKYGKGMSINILYFMVVMIKSGCGQW